MTSLSCAVRFSHALLLLLVSVSLLPRESLAEGETPASILGLMPAGSTLSKSSWDALETEFGVSFNSDLVAEDFSGKKPSCHYGPITEFKITLQGDTAFEQPPMLDMALQQFRQDFESTVSGLTDFVAGYVKPAPDVVSVDSAQREALGIGEIVYVELVENCSNHPNGTKTMMRGYAHRGATRVSFNRVASGNADAARAVAAEIFQKFEQLDIAALNQ